MHGSRFTARARARRARVVSSITVLLGRDVDPTNQGTVPYCVSNATTHAPDPANQCGALVPGEPGPPGDVAEGRAAAVGVHEQRSLVLAEVAVEVPGRRRLPGAVPGEHAEGRLVVAGLVAVVRGNELEERVERLVVDL